MITNPRLESYALQKLTKLPFLDILNWCRQGRYVLSSGMFELSLTL